MWDEITYPFLNFYRYTIEVFQWLCNFIQHCTRHVILLIHAGIKVDQDNANQNTQRFIHIHAYEYVACEMAVILFRER